MILAIDLDGTMLRFFFSFMPGAREVLQDLIKRGFIIRAVTRRTNLQKLITHKIFAWHRLEAIEIVTVSKNESKAEKVKGCWGFIDNEADNFIGIDENIHRWLFSREPHPILQTVSDWNILHKAIIAMV